MRRTWLTLYKQSVEGTWARGNSSTDERFWGILGANYCAQLTSYNTGASFEDTPAVESVLAACGVVEEDHSNRDLVFCVPKDSPSDLNVRSGGLCSLVYGSTNPQTHHFFKQLSVRCWTSTVTGRGESLQDASAAEAWDTCFSANPYLVNALKPATPLKTKVPPARARRVADEEEEADDVPTLRFDRFSLWRLHRENGFLGRPPGGMDKVSVLVVPPVDPLAAHVQKWVSRVNFRRDILVEGVRTAYSIPLANCFCFHLDARGLYVMGCTDEDPTWQEYFLEWGPSMTFDQPKQITSWWREFVSQTNISYDDVYSATPEDLMK
ncbi:hypothetical protein DIPPA_01215 [Diplonema papillatum]|nr:hypothetical protein DIPPA_25845 [Diplonema papillatum]KAJ9446815.1 hypothetical protein DIPPA_01215 [Diplonema papillatum]